MYTYYWVFVLKKKHNKKTKLKNQHLNIVKLNQVWIVITLFPFDLSPNEIQFGAKSTGKVR